MFFQFLLKIKNSPDILSFEAVEQLVLSSHDKYCLDLSSKNLNDEHMGWLLKILTKETIREIICLSDNKITNVGAIRLGELLQRFPQILSIRLQRNNIGPQGVQYLIKAAELNNNLVSIELSGNGLEENITAKVGQRLEINSQIQEEFKKVELYKTISKTMIKKHFLPYELLKIILDYYNDASNKEARKYLKTNLYSGLL